MASKVTPYFILTAEGVAPSEPSNICDVTREQMDDERIYNEALRANKKQQSVSAMTRKELTRKRMELIQQKLEESRARHAEKQKTLSLNLSRPMPRMCDAFMPRTPHTYVPPETSHKIQTEQSTRNVEMVPLSVQKPASGDMPYVYFVVSVDRLQRSKTDMSSSSMDDTSMGSSLSGNSSVKRKNKTFSRNSRRRRKGNESSPTQPMVSKSDGNFSITQKQMVAKKMLLPFQYNSSPVIPPPTPATVTTYNMQDRTEEDIHIERMTSIGDLRDFNDNRANFTGKASPKLIELPYISAELQRKNLGSSNASMEGKAMEVYRKAIAQEANKRVHFAEGFDLPTIRGSAVTIPRGLISTLGPRPTTMPTIMSNRDDFERYLRDDIPKTAFGTPRPRKNCQPLNLPKIDIVSGVYDELIVKAIEAYIHEFPPGSKQGSVARQLLRQLQDRTITASDLAQFDRKPRHQGLKIKELDSDNTKASEKSGGKTPRGSKRPIKPKADGEFSTLAPTCFQMVAPGTQSARDEVTIVSLR